MDVTGRHTHNDPQDRTDPIDPIKNFFRQGHFAGGAQGLYFKSVEFHRTFQEYYSLLFQRFKEATPLDKKDGYFLFSSWAPLVKTGAESIYITLMDVLPGLRLEKGELMKQAAHLVTLMGFGQTQIIESTEHVFRLRVYDSLEDLAYVEKMGRAAYPVSAYTAGLVLGCYSFLENIFPASDPGNMLTGGGSTGRSAGKAIDMTISEISELQQVKCQAEEGAFSEFRMQLR